jgi:predicted secreted protein
MGIASGLLVYIMIWWLVFFCLLPIGMKHDDGLEFEGQKIYTPNQSNLRMKHKIILCCLISAGFWGITDFIILMEWISFR